jgi:hypothetical protein
MDLTELSKDLGAVSTQLAAWAAAELPNLLAALLILGFGWWLSGAAGRAVAHVIDTQPYAWAKYRRCGNLNGTRTREQDLWGLG